MPTLDNLEHPSDLSSVCDVALPFANRHLRGLALSRFKGSARVVGCTQKPGSGEGHSVRQMKPRTLGGWRPDQATPQRADQD